MTTLPQQVTINQYIADGITSAYTYNFLILQSTDIAVYLTPPNEPPNPTADKKVLSTDYTVTGEGNVNGGLITFLVAPELGSVVTLARDIQFEITTNFAVAQTISGVNLDNAFQRITLMCQQLGSDYALRGLQYFINAIIPTNPENVATTITELPVLNQGEIWQGTDTNNVIAVTLEEDIDVSTLRSELASEVQNADGARLIGYYDEYFNVSNTLAEFLNGLPPYILDVVASTPAAAGFQTGDRKPSWNATPLAGWILEQNGTIGSATSGASIIADSTAQALFEMFWNGYSDAICPVSGGRGANATADWVANKRISLPSVNGTAIVNYFGTYTPGTLFGSNTVTLDITTMPAHSHDYSVTLKPPAVGATNFPTYGAGVSNGFYGTNTGTIGGGLPHENRQPSQPCYIHIKL